MSNLSHFSDDWVVALSVLLDVPDAPSAGIHSSFGLSTETELTGTSPVDAPSTGIHSSGFVFETEMAGASPASAPSPVSPLLY